MPSRREFLKASATVAAGGSILTQPALAATDSDLSADPYWNARPDHTTINFDKTALERYQPMLVTSHLDYKPNALYGWVAESTARETSIAVYWADYDRQEGLSPFGGSLSDSHLGDHEPIQVEFDPDTGQVLGVRYSAYHWLAGRAPRYGVPLYDGTHPQFRVIKPWHQTAITAEEGVLDVPVRSLLASTPEYDTRYEEWLIEDELANALRIGSNTVPWIMREHESWWKDTTDAFGLGFSSYEWTAKFYKRMSSMPWTDYGGAADSDEIEEVE